jgi:hypothetical protein
MYSADGRRWQRNVLAPDCDDRAALSMKQNDSVDVRDSKQPNQPIASAGV